MHGASDTDTVRLPNGGLELREVKEILRLLRIYPRGSNGLLREKLHGALEDYRRELIAKRSDGLPQRGSA